MNSVLNQLKILSGQELYSNIVKVCDLALTVGEQKPETLTLSMKLQVIIYYADALYHTQKYIQAENLYRQALQMRKSLLMKSKNSSNKLSESQNDIASDVDIKYKIYLCCIASKQKTAAAEILQMISARMRTPKINMALGNIYKEMGMERAAITCYKEVLKECPLALDAAENLLKFGMKGTEINSLVVEVSSDIPWLNSWVKAQSQMHSKDFSGAIKTFKTMDSNGLLKDNSLLAINMGYCYHYMCEDSKAITVLQKAFRSDPNLITGKDLLSTLLAASGTKEHLRYLENLVPTLDMSLWSVEHWTILGNFMLSQKKYEKALYFAQQACIMDRRNTEAFLLKANAAFYLKKYQDAATYCTDALQICSYRYDVHKCLVDCYLQLNRLREAETMAINACKQLNFSAQGYCLHATVLLKDPMASNKILRKTLEEAVVQDKTAQTNALYMLVEFLEHEQQFEQASQLLSNHIEKHKPTSKLHQLLGDCFVNLQRDDDAFHHYTVALNLDPTNQRATEGLNNIGRNLSLSKRDSYYGCVGGESPYALQGNNSSEQNKNDNESDTDSWPASGGDLGNFE